jgi:hypothetical protein
MSKFDASKIDLEKVKAAASKGSPGHRGAAPAQIEPSEEDKSKDAFFVQVGEMAEAMIARHGNEFAIGTLVLAAKFIAEGRPLIKGRPSISRDIGNSERASAVASAVEPKDEFRESKSIFRT